MVKQWRCSANGGFVEPVWWARNLTGIFTGYRKPDSDSNLRNSESKTVSLNSRTVLREEKKADVLAQEENRRSNLGIAEQMPNAKRHLKTKKKNQDHRKIATVDANNKEPLSLLVVSAYLAIFSSSRSLGSISRLRSYMSCTSPAPWRLLRT